MLLIVFSFHPRARAQAETARSVSNAAFKQPLSIENLQNKENIHSVAHSSLPEKDLDSAEQIDSPVYSGFTEKWNRYARKEDSSGTRTGSEPDPYLEAVSEDSVSEEEAIRMIRSPRFYLRMRGVRELERYKSEKNIRLLTRLLRDDWFYLYGSGKILKRYPVRNTARRVLEKWQVAFEVPVIEEEVDIRN
jgi:hypothetical protein